MEFPHISAALGAFLIMLQQLLMLSVGLHRTKAKVGIGLDGDPDLERKVRRHGNLAENAGLLVVVLALTEMSGASSNVVVGFAWVFAIARTLHAIGFMHLDGSHANLQGNRLFLISRVLGATATAWGGFGLGGYLAYVLLTT